MREVAIVSFAHTASRRADECNEVELLLPVVTEALLRARVPRERIGFTVSASCDFLSGLPFAFVQALDAIGAWPPISESHVEMDGAFALYEAWVRLQHGDVDAALVYAFGKASQGDLQDVLALQLDPYYLAPLCPDPISLAALQARSYLMHSGRTERDLAQVAERAGRTVTAGPYLASPLRRHDCPPISDGAAAVVLAAGELAQQVCPRPAWIRGIDHRVEPQALGARDLCRCASAELAAERAGLFQLDRPVDVAELHAPFSHQVLMLREALRLGEQVRVNPSGGALAENPLMVAGLVRLGEAARPILTGEAHRTVGHATSGPCLQQNLVCVLQGAP